jgi:hypothetical protein
MEISSLVPSESPSVTVGSEQIKSSDSFGTANSFNAFGKYVLVVFLSSFLHSMYVDPRKAEVN